MAERFITKVFLWIKPIPEATPSPPANPPCQMLPKSAGSPPLTRLQNRACVFRFTRLLSCVALVVSTVIPTGLGDSLSALHTYLGQRRVHVICRSTRHPPLHTTAPTSAYPGHYPRPLLLGRSHPNAGHTADYLLIGSTAARESRLEVTPFRMAVGWSP